MSISVPLKPLSFDQINDYCLYEVLKYIQFNDLIYFVRVNGKWKANIKSALKRLQSFSIESDGNVTWGPFNDHLCHDEHHVVPAVNHHMCSYNPFTAKFKKLMEKLPFVLAYFCPNLIRINYPCAIIGH